MLKKNATATLVKLLACIVREGRWLRTNIMKRQFDRTVRRMHLSICSQNRDVGCDDSTSIGRSSTHSGHCRHCRI